MEEVIYVCPDSDLILVSSMSLFKKNSAIVMLAHYVFGSDWDREFDGQWTDVFNSLVFPTCLVWFCFVAKIDWDWKCIGLCSKATEPQLRKISSLLSPDPNQQPANISVHLARSNLWENKVFWSFPSVVPINKNHIISNSIIELRIQKLIVFIDSREKSESYWREIY
jgi:hypothetical protein